MTVGQTADRRAAQFVRAHLGRDAFAPFTGQDAAAWRAYCHLLECSVLGASWDGALAALRATVALAQPKESILRCFVQAIPGVLDWSDVARLWPAICHGIPVPPDCQGYRAVNRSVMARID